MERGREPDLARAGGGYAHFAGREVARALAVMSLDPKDCSADLAGVTPKQRETLGDWVAKFEKKYKVVGQARTLALRAAACRAAPAMASVRPHCPGLACMHTRQCA
jgi:hypothetical protein